MCDIISSRIVERSPCAAPTHILQNSWGSVRVFPQAMSNSTAILLLSSFNLISCIRKEGRGLVVRLLHKSRKSMVERPKILDFYLRWPGTLSRKPGDKQWNVCWAQQHKTLTRMQEWESKASWDQGQCFILYMCVYMYTYMRFSLA